MKIHLLILKPRAKALPKLALKDHCRGILYLPTSIPRHFSVQQEWTSYTHRDLDRPAYVSLLFLFLRHTPRKRKWKNFKASLTPTQYFNTIFLHHHTSTDTSYVHLLSHIFYSNTLFTFINICMHAFKLLILAS